MLNMIIPGRGLPIFLPPLAAFLFVYISMPFFRGIAFKYRIVDFPGRRKMHKTMTPLLGGLAIYVGYVVGMLLSWPISNNALVILIASSIILVLGIVDDARGLSARFRLIVQFIASLIVVLFGGRIEFLPPGDFFNAVEIIISLIWLVGITNAYNYIDGLDGLATGCAVISLSMFGAILFVTHQFGMVPTVVILATSCIGFLPYNFAKGRKKTFLGDAGSTFLGFVMASVGLCGYWARGSIVKISIPILILGVPIFDMVFTTVMRIAEKKVKSVHEWLKYAGKDHFHHYLVEIGLGRIGAVVLIYFATISLGLSAIIVARSGPLTAIASTLQGAIIFSIIAVLIVLGNRKRNDKH